jgi:hypothetical protein
LFALAVLVVVCASALLLMYRHELPLVGRTA